MEIYGKSIGKKELLSRIGDIEHLGGLRSFTFNDGASKDIRAYNIRNAAGLSFNILIDRGMDISELYYKEVPFSLTTPIRVSSPYFFNDRGDGFLRSFFGGFLTTCGIAYMGESCVDNGEELGLHGRISNIPAEKICASGEWEKDNYKIFISGRIRETKLYGSYLELNRKYTIFMDKPVIHLTDIIENIGFRTSPVMILYHFNFGYPLLDENTELFSGKSEVIPTDYGDSKKDFKQYNKFSGPVKDYEFQVFFHNIEPDRDNYSNVALINESFNNNRGIGISLKYNKDSLPHLIQWKYLAEGEYVCGLEPANSLVRGRKIEREEGNLKTLEPGEKMIFNLEITILESNREIERFRMESS